MTFSAVGGGDPKTGSPIPKRVGLLGGSFNPAHSGHLRISQLALELLSLDQMWWLVSPQNPLKSPRDMAPFEARLHQARTVAEVEPRIQVSDLEKRLGTQYTADTLPMVKARFGGIRFVWVMGADNLAQIHRWRQWTRIFRAVPVAVFDRPTYSFRAMSGVAARRFSKHRIDRARAASLANRQPPAWVFLSAAFDTASATAIREENSSLRSGVQGHRA